VNRQRSWINDNNKAHGRRFSTHGRIDSMHYVASEPRFKERIPGRKKIRVKKTHKTR
jgi:hypothetical protein